MPDGAIYQLVADHNSPETSNITGTPEITLFKSVYRRYEPFSKHTYTIPIKGKLEFGKLKRIPIKRMGDILHKMYISLTISQFGIDKNKPTVISVNKLLDDNNVVWNHNLNQNLILDSSYYMQGYNDSITQSNNLPSYIDSNDIKIINSERNETSSKPYILNGIEDTLDLFINQFNRNIAGMESVVNIYNNFRFKDRYIFSFNVLESLYVETVSKETMYNLYQMLRAYYEDILLVKSGIELINAKKIRKSMYEFFLTRLIEDPVPGISIDSRIYMSIYLYHIIDIWRYTINSPEESTKIYFDRIVDSELPSLKNNESGYGYFDGIMVYQKYLDGLPNRRSNVESVNNLTIVSQGLLDHILWNFRINYRQMLKYINFLENSGFRNSSHYRLGFYKKYNLSSDIYEPQGSLFNIVYGESGTATSNNLELLLPNTGDVPLNINRYIIDETNTIISDFIKRSGGNVNFSSNASDYYNQYNIWSRLLTSNTFLVSKLDPTTYNNYTSEVFGTGRVALMNLVPLLVVFDIPLLLYDILKIKSVDAQLISELDYRDEAGRGTTPPQNVTNLHTDFVDKLTLALLTDNSGNIVDAEYMSSINQSLLTRGNEYLIFGIFRPEGILEYNGVKYTPIQYVTERYRDLLKIKVETLYSSGIYTTSKEDLLNYIDNSIDSFVRSSVMNISTYKSNGYTNYPDSILNNQVFKYSDCLSTIWNIAYLNFISNYNWLHNQNLLSKSGYISKYGASMVSNLNELYTELESDNYSNLHNSPDNGGFMIKTVDTSIEDCYNYYAIRGVSNWSKNIITYINQKLDYFNQVFDRYQDRKPILNIRYESLGEYNYTYNSIQKIVDQYGILLTDNYIREMEIELQPVVTDILNNAKAEIVATKKGVIDYLIKDRGSGNYPSNKLELNLKEVIYLLTEGNSSGFDNLDAWMKSVNNEKIITDIYNLYSNISNSISPEKLYTTRGIESIYRGFEDYLSIVLYLIYNLFRSMGYSYLVNEIGKTIDQTSINYINRLGREAKLVYDKIGKLSVSTKSITINTTDDPDVFPISVLDKNNSDDPDPYLSYSGYGENGVLDIKGSSIETSILSLLNSSRPKFAWARELGHKLIEYSKIYLNGTLIEETDSDLATFLGNIYTTKEQKRGYDIMIGNTPDVYLYDSNMHNEIQLYVPFRFWFNRGIETCLPMIALLHTDIYIDFQLQKMENLLFMEKSSFLTKKPKIKGNILAEYYFLDKDSRKKMGTLRHDYLINRFVKTGDEIYTKMDIIDKKIKISAIPKYVTKMFLWTLKFSKGNELIPATEKHLETFKIKYSGRTREVEKPTSFYNLATADQIGIPTLPPGHYIYSPSITPLRHQPTGSMNMNNISDYAIITKLNEPGISLLNNGYVLEFKHWAMSYDFLSIYSGMAGLIF